MVTNEVNVLTMLGNDTGYTPVLIFTFASMIVRCNHYHVIITVFEGEPLYNLTTISHKLIIDAYSTWGYWDVQYCFKPSWRCEAYRLRSFALANSSLKMAVEMDALVNIAR
jgi:hypothetical protein